MKRFKFKAKDKTGKLVEGEVEANDENLAAKLLRGRELIVLSIQPVRNIDFPFVSRFKNRISFGDVSTFTRQLATMVNAGLPLTEALLILRSQSKGGLQRVVSETLARVEEGEALSSAMSKYPQIFSKTYIALIKSGEVGGVLDEVLVKLADNLEKQAEFRGKVKSAMIYPAIIIVGMVAVATIMLVFVIPRLTTLYDQFNAKLPLSTKLLISVSNFMSHFWYIMFAVVFAAIYVFNLYSKSKAGKKRIDTIMLKIPLIGNLQQQIILADLTRTLSLMVGSGVSILEAIEITSEVVGNTIIAEALQDIAKLVEKGFPIAFSFSKHADAFPFILSQMIAVGEETGKMDEVLAKLSHVFETESDQKLKAVTSAIEPAILIVLGVGVAFLVISIILPIYNLTTQI